jgi:hypothetical protein
MLKRILVMTIATVVATSAWAFDTPAKKPAASGIKTAPAPGKSPVLQKEAKGAAGSAKTQRRGLEVTAAKPIVIKSDKPGHVLTKQATKQFKTAPVEAVPNGHAFTTLFNEKDGGYFPKSDPIYLVACSYSGKFDYASVERAFRTGVYAVQAKRKCPQSGKLYEVDFSPGQPLVFGWVNQRTNQYAFLGVNNTIAKQMNVLDSLDIENNHIPINTWTRLEWQTGNVKVSLEVSRNADAANGQLGFSVTSLETRQDR